MRIGILAGFDEALVEAVQQRLRAAAEVELVELSIGATLLADVPSVDILLDRASHENAFYRAYVEQAQARGVRVINPPQRTGVGCAYADLVRAQRAGFATVPTLLLPAKAYAAHIGASALKNLAFPLDWEALLAQLGGRALLLPALPFSGMSGVPVEDTQGLLQAYDQTGMTPTLLQARPEGDSVRAWCVRGQAVLMQATEAAHSAESLAPLAQRVFMALDLDLAALDFCVTKDAVLLRGVEAAAPELDPELVGADIFAGIVDNIAAFLSATAAAGAPASRRGPAKKRKTGAGRTTAPDALR